MKRSGLNEYRSGEKNFLVSEPVFPTTKHFLKKQQFIRRER